MLPVAVPPVGGQASATRFTAMVALAGLMETVRISALTRLSQTMHHGDDRLVEDLQSHWSMHRGMPHMHAMRVYAAFGGSA
jgi:hypothetical protein